MIPEEKNVKSYLLFSTVRLNVETEEWIKDTRSITLSVWCPWVNNFFFANTIESGCQEAGQSYEVCQTLFLKKCIIFLFHTSDTSTKDGSVGSKQPEIKAKFSFWSLFCLDLRIATKFCRVIKNITKMAFCY